MVRNFLFLLIMTYTVFLYIQCFTMHAFFFRPGLKQADEPTGCEEYLTETTDLHQGLIRIILLMSAV